jgi:hypothetical protein
MPSHQTIAECRPPARVLAPCEQVELLGRARVVEIMRRGGIGAEDLAAAGLREDLRA